MHRYKEEGEEVNQNLNGKHRREMYIVRLTADELMVRPAWRQTITSHSNDPTFKEKSGKKKSVNTFEHVYDYKLYR